MKRIFALLCLLLSAFNASAQTSFVVLGDLHLDKFDFHDMDYVYTRPSDWRQVTCEYPYFTAAYMPKLFDAVGRRVSEGCCAVLQLGDLMEGVAGNETLATDMARYAVDAINRASGTAKVILTKGNHDVSASPGQPEAWKNVVLPYISAETGKQLSDGMYCYSLGENVDLFVAEQFFSPDQMLPEQALLDFLKHELPKSKARYRFLLTHQPVIPVTERCWHLFSGIRRKVEDTAVREEFLELLAEYHVTVLCAHLHKYSQCVRSTAKGNVVQLMFVSTIDSFDCDRKPSAPKPYLTAADVRSDWQPHTLETRRAIIEAERPSVKYFTCSYLPGYATVTIDRNATVSYFVGYSDTACETVDIDSLYAK